MGNTITLYYVIEDGKKEDRKIICGKISGVRQQQKELDARIILTERVAALSDLSFSRNKIKNWINLSMQERGIQTRWGEEISRKSYIECVNTKTMPLNINDIALCSILLEGSFLVGSHGDTYEVPSIQLKFNKIK